MDVFRLQPFKEVVGQTFEALASGNAGQMTVQLVLAEAEPLPYVAVENVPDFVRRDPFALLFSGPVDSPIAQQQLQMSHETLGTFEVFMVPVGEDNRGRLYQVTVA